MRRLVPTEEKRHWEGPICLILSCPCLHVCEGLLFLPVSQHFYFFLWLPCSPSAITAPPPKHPSMGGRRTCRGRRHAGIGKSASCFRYPTESKHCCCSRRRKEGGRARRKERPTHARRCTQSENGKNGESHVGRKQKEQEKKRQESD